MFSIGRDATSKLDESIVTGYHSRGSPLSDTEDASVSARDSTLSPPPKRRPWRDLLVSLLVTFALTAFLFLELDVTAFKNGLRRVDYWVLAPVVCLHGLSWVVRAIRWRVLLLPVCSVPAGNLFRLVMIGAMISSIVPARAGEFWRAYALGSEAGVSRSTAFGTIVVERVLDGFTVALLAATAALFIGPGGSVALLVVSAAVLFVGAFAALALFIRSERVRAFSMRLGLSLTPRRYRAFVATQFELFNTGLSTIRTSRTLASALLLSFLAYGVDAVGYWLLGSSFGFDVEPFGYLLVVAVGNLAVALPLSIAGIGPFEFFVQQSLTAMGVSSSVALAYALLLHALTLVFVSLAGLASLWINLARPPRSEVR
jgi:glycosyltransferase 2 family protein